MLTSADGFIWRTIDVTRCVRPVGFAVMVAAKAENVRPHGPLFFIRQTLLYPTRIVLFCLTPNLLGNQYILS
eukprot:COSAG04_NODE_827_length_10036_cov_6.659455_8_plen_72_part_00